MSAAELRKHLTQLQAERSFAGATGAPAVAELEQDIAVLRDAYVGAAVTEIATLRAELSGPQVG